METRRRVARGLVDRLGVAWDRIVLRAARDAVDAVRYRPPHVSVVLACGASQPEVPSPVVSWWAGLRIQPGFLAFSAQPHALVRLVSSLSARWFGPTASALIRWFSGAAAAAIDHATAQPIERSLRARAHPGLLVPHPHAVVIVAVDMRGFSQLTRELRDTQYLTNLIGDYLTALTTVVESFGGIIFQYTGDGLLAVFLPELSGMSPADLLVRLTRRMCPALHDAFDVLADSWRAEWAHDGRSPARIGLGVGLSFGPATLGFIGAAGKKQIGVIGEPVNVAAYLCSQARAGTVLIDHGSFLRTGATPPAVKVVRLRSKKPHQRIDTICLPRTPRPKLSFIRT